MSSPNTPVDIMLGPEVVTLLHRNDVTEIYNNDDGYIWYQSHQDGKVKTKIHLEPKKIMALIELIAGQCGKIINEDIPSLSTEIRGYGCRFQGEVPPIVKNPQFNLRKPAIRIFTLDEYVANGSMSQEYCDFLKEAIVSRKNILVVGGTGTGKTTFLNAVLDSIAKLSPNHRIISLEDLPELQCSAEDYSPMFTKQETNKQGIKYNMTRLLADCMRRSPDRIVVGEVRDGAAYTMLKAWNTGHEGGACTVHANDAVRGLSRILALAEEDPEASTNEATLKKLISESIDVVVSIVYVDLGNGKKGRKVNEIIQVDGYSHLNDEYLIKRI